jgi:hypothetical protein
VSVPVVNLCNGPDSDDDPDAVVSIEAPAKRVIVVDLINDVEYEDLIQSPPCSQTYMV